MGYAGDSSSTSSFFNSNIDVIFYVGRQRVQAYLKEIFKGLAFYF